MFRGILIQQPFHHFVTGLESHSTESLNLLDQQFGIRAADDNRVVGQQTLGPEMQALTARSHYHSGHPYC
jgi:hypothetical protein